MPNPAQWLVPACKLSSPNTALPATIWGPPSIWRVMPCPLASARGPMPEKQAGCCFCQGIPSRNCHVPQASVLDQSAGHHAAAGAAGAAARGGGPPHRHAPERRHSALCPEICIVISCATSRSMVSVDDAHSPARRLRWQCGGAPDRQTRHRGLGSCTASTHSRASGAGAAAQVVGPAATGCSAQRL